MSIVRFYGVCSIRYVVITEYAPSDARIAAYQLVTDLPSEICREIADSWFMGETSVVPVDTQQLAGFAAGIGERAGACRGSVVPFLLAQIRKHLRICLTEQRQY